MPIRLQPTATRASVRPCDWSGNARLGKRGYKHLAIAERGDPQVAEEYLPIIHLVFANLKTWLNGTHHGGSHQHLQAYLNVPLQQAVLSVQCLPFTARHRGRHYRTDLCGALLRCLEAPYILGVWVKTG